MFLRSTTGKLQLAALIASLPACASQHESLRRELTDLKREVVSLRAVQVALRERVDALEHAPPASEAKPSEAAPASAEDPEARPSLDVVRLTPDAQGSDGWTTIDPSDPKRPKLVTGSAVPDSCAAGADPRCAPTVIQTDRTGRVIQARAPMTTIAQPPTPQPPTMPPVAQRK
jgi:hypothetical protein